MAKKYRDTEKTVKKQKKLLTARRKFGIVTSIKGHWQFNMEAVGRGIYGR